MEIRGTIICKKADNKAFKLGENWYNVNDPAIPYLEKMSKGDMITVTYEKKGTSRYVSKLTGGQTEQAEESQSSTTGFHCEVCGKALKDDKFKKCYTCNKSGATKKEESSETSTSEFTCEDCGKALKDGKYKKCYTCGKKSPKSNTSYDNPEKTAQIQRGNALNAAGAVASSQQFADPDTAQQFTLMLAESFLTWLRGE